MFFYSHRHDRLSPPDPGRGTLQPNPIPGRVLAVVVVASPVAAGGRASVGGPGRAADGPARIAARRGPRPEPPRVGGTPRPAGRRPTDPDGAGVRDRTRADRDPDPDLQLASTPGRDRGSPPRRSVHPPGPRPSAL